MKKFYFLLFLITSQLTFAQDYWKSIGPNDFDNLFSGYNKYSEENALAFDEKDMPYVMIHDEKEEGIMVKKFNGKSWDLFGGRAFETYQYSSNYNLLFDTDENLYMSGISHNTINPYYDEDGNYYYGQLRKPFIKQYKNGVWSDIPSPEEKRPIYSANTTDVSYVIDKIFKSNYLSIHLDKNNILYACYTYGHKNKIVVKKFNGTNWELVGESGFSLQEARNPHLNFDNNNTPYVVYQDQVSDYKITAQKFNGTKWEVVGDMGLSDKEAYYAKLLFDQNNIPYLSYIEISLYSAPNYREPHVIIKKLEDGKWTNYTDFYDKGAFDVNLLDFKSLFLFDSDNLLTYGILRPFLKKSSLFKFNQGEWSRINSSEIFTSVAFNNKKELFGIEQKIIEKTTNYTTATHYETVLKKYIGDSWEQIQNIGISDTQAKDLLITTDSQNTPYIAYLDRSTKVSVQKFNGTKWEYLVKSGVTTGGASVRSLKTDSNDHLYILCQDWGIKGDVFLYKYNGSNFEVIGTGIPNTNNPVFTFDNNDIPYITYTDLKNSERVVVKKLNGSVWENVEKSSISIWTAEKPKITVDKNNSLIIAYQDMAYDGKTTIQKFDGTKWETIGNIGSSNSISNNCSVTTNKNSEIIVAYLEKSSISNNKNKAIVQLFNGNNWEILGNIDFADSNIHLTKIVVDKNNIPYLLCLSFDGIIKVYKLIDNQWKTVGLNNIAATTSWNADITINQNNIPIVTYSHVSFYNQYERQNNPTGLAFVKFIGGDEYTLSNNELYFNTKQTTLAYPNPFKTIMHIEGDYSQAQIYDYTGRLIKNTLVINQSIDLSELISGSYILKLSSGKNQETIKIIKE